jgi:hypothetical protein
MEDLTLPVITSPVLDAYAALEDAEQDIGVNYEPQEDRVCLEDAYSDSLDTLQETNKTHMIWAGCDVGDISLAYSLNYAIEHKPTAQFSLGEKVFLTTLSKPELERLIWATAKKHGLILPEEFQAPKPFDPFSL